MESIFTLPTHVTADQATRKFTLSHAISEHYGTKWCYEDEGSTGRELLRWVLTGFSAVLILLGQTATGKTHTVFERGTGVKELQMPWVRAREKMQDLLLHGGILLRNFFTSFNRRIATSHCLIGCSSKSLTNSRKRNRAMVHTMSVSPCGRLPPKTNWWISWQQGMSESN